MPIHFFVTGFPGTPTTKGAPPFSKAPMSGAIPAKPSVHGGMMLPASTSGEPGPMV